MGHSHLSLLSAAATGVIVGLLAGRPRSHIRSTVKGNYKWMTKEERQLVTALVSNGQGYLFQHWAPPGVKDDAKRRLLRAVASAVGSVGPSLEPLRLETLEAPLAAEVPKELVEHGDVRVDPYYWLRDDERRDPRVLGHLRAENSHTAAAMAGTEALQQALYLEMRGRMQEADADVPARYRGYYYYSRTLEGQQYRVHVRRRVPPGAGPPSETDAVDESQPEEVLLDENKRKEEGGFTFYMVGGSETSPDNRLFAWAEDTVGDEHYTLRVKDLSTGAEVMAPIPDTAGSVEWGNDNATLLYLLLDHLQRPYKVMRHVIGSGKPDEVLFEESDESFYVSIGKTRSESYLTVSSGSAVTSEVHILNADDPRGPLRVVRPRQEDVEYSLGHRGSHLYLLMRDRARPNSELLVAPVDDPSETKVLVPHRRDVKLDTFSLSSDYLVLFERSGGLQRGRVHRLPPGGATLGSAAELGSGTPLEFDEPAYSLSGGCTGDFDSPVLRLHYTSLTTPMSTIDHHMATGARAVKKVQPVLGGYDKSLYVTERLWATAPDGVKVPLSVVYRKGLAKLDGSSPLLLNGYGAYEYSNDPYFSSNRLCLLDRGWVFALAHIRGGGEMGRFWYEDGKYLHKRNTFTDFIACAEHLIEQRYTSAPRLAIEGRSAGGLLIGATLNLRPELFHAAILGVPFVDVLTTMLDPSIPLTITEWEEWGNPKEPEYYAYMKSYSPYDNVRPDGSYPNILVTAGLHDPRVGYWEPAKLVAKLRKLRNPGSNRLLLLKCELGAGHFSVTGRFERLKEIAFEYAFLLKTAGDPAAQGAPAPAPVVVGTGQGK